MKNKKSLIAIVVLLLVATIGVTIAYFQSSASFENIFNTGTYKVSTTETFESPDNWKPGQSIPKVITSTNEGSIPAAIRLSLNERWEDDDGNDITGTISESPVTINYSNTLLFEKEGNYYYYKYILNPDDTMPSFINSVSLNSNVNDVVCTDSQDGLTKTCESSNPAFGSKYFLTITIETVQYDKYQSLWNTNMVIDKSLSQEKNIWIQYNKTSGAAEEVCGSFTNAILCLEGGKWDCEYNESTNTCDNTTGYIMTKKKEFEDAGLTCLLTRNGQNDPLEPLDPYLLCYDGSYDDPRFINLYAHSYNNSAGGVINLYYKGNLLTSVYSVD